MSLTPGRFTTDFYSEENNIIPLKGGVDISVYNSGTATAIINGQKFAPEETFKIGSSNIRVYGQITVRFEGVGIRQVAVNYIQPLKEGEQQSC